MNNNHISDMWFDSLKNDIYNDKEKTEIVIRLFENNIFNIEKLNFFNPIIQMIKLDYNINIIQNLIEKKANINITDNLGYNPLYLSIKRKSDKLTYLLLKYKSDVNLSNELIDNQIPLHIACVNNNYSICKKLLYLKSNPNIIDNYDNTPLDYYIEYNTNNNINIDNCQKFFIELLIKKNTDINNVNKNTNKLPLIKIKEKVDLDKCKKKLHLYKSLNERLSKNSLIQNIPDELLEIICNSI